MSKLRLNLVMEETLETERRDLAWRLHICKHFSLPRVSTKEAAKSLQQLWKKKNTS